MAAPIIFTGISFPFRARDGEFPVSATDDDLIKESLLQLVLTSRGERIMRPDLGNGVLGLVFENNTEVLSDMIRAELQSAISRFEPRVSLVDTLTRRKESSVTVTIRYVIRANGREGLLTVDIPSPGA